MTLHKPPRLFFFFLLLFLLHQITQKLWHISIPFADNYLDCLLCVPILLGGMLLERQLFFQKGKPHGLSKAEIIIAVLFFSIIFEGLFPWLSDGFTRDYYDVLCYGIGGWIFYWFMNTKDRS